MIPCIQNVQNRPIPERNEGEGLPGQEEGQGVPAKPCRVPAGVMECSGMRQRRRAHTKCPESPSGAVLGEGGIRPGVSAGRWPGLDRDGQQTRPEAPGPFAAIEV